MPATLVSQAGCPGCQVATVTLRPDGSFLLRDQLGAAEFYDFGRWRFADGRLELAGDRDTRNYRLDSFADTRAAETLRREFRKQPGPALVSIDAQLEGSPEVLRPFRPAAVHSARACP